MFISPVAVRTGTKLCLLYITTLLDVGGYFLYETWQGWYEGVLTHQLRSGRLVVSKQGDPGWYWMLSTNLFFSSLGVMMGLRFLLIFFLPRHIRERELSKLADRDEKQTAIPIRAVILVVLFFIAILTIPLWQQG